MSAVFTFDRLPLTHGAIVGSFMGEVVKRDHSLYTEWTLPCLRDDRVGVVGPRESRRFARPVTDTTHVTSVTEVGFLQVTPYTR